MEYFLGTFNFLKNPKQVHPARYLQYVYTIQYNESGKSGPGTRMYLVESPFSGPPGEFPPSAPPPPLPPPSPPLLTELLLARTKLETLPQGNV